MLQKSFNIDTDSNLSYDDKKLLISFLNEQEKFQFMNKKVKELMKSKKL